MSTAQWPYPVNKMNLRTLIDKEFDLDNDGKLFEKFNECCFDIIISATKIDDTYQVFVEIGPEEDSKYEVIVDYAIIIDDTVKFTERDHWSKKEIIESVSVYSSKLRIRFGIAVHQPLISENVNQKTTFRYYRVLCADQTFYVNPANLKKLGCSMFDKWYDEEVTHEEYSIVQELSPDDLKLLLTACCGYSNIVIDARNVYQLGEIGVELKIVSIIRAIDAFIGELKTMHMVRKLECALNYKLTLVADGILKKTRGYLVRLELLHEYLQENNEREEDLPPDVLAMLDVFDDYVII